MKHDQPRARWTPFATVPAGIPFVDALARWLAEQATDLGAQPHPATVRPDPLALSRMRVMVPSRRSVRALREAFLRLSDGQPWTLPAICAIGDPDEDMVGLLGQGAPGGSGILTVPPAIEPARRQAILARMVLAREPELGPEQALLMAGDLARLIDEVTRERLDFATLPDLVTDRELATHWGETVRFLTIVTEAWPHVLAAEGVIDPADRLDRLLAAQAALWRSQPPSAPVVIAGLGSASPSVVDLIKTVLELPRGLIVLPGLDRALDEESWSQLSDTHPQAGFKRLLKAVGIDRADVPDLAVPWDRPRWPGALLQRQALVREVMRPAETSDAWRQLSDLYQPALAGLQRLDCPTLRDEAGSIALILREVLETPGRTAAVVTPDRRLARMVAGALARWSLIIDDSGGRRLGELPVGTFLRLVARALVPGAGPVAWLALLKHPLAAAGMDRPAWVKAAQTLDHAVRGPRPRAGLAGLYEAVNSVRSISRSDRAHALAMLDALGRCVQPCADLIAAAAGEKVAATDVLDAHMRAAEALAATPDQPGPLRLWRGDDGEAAARLAADLLIAWDELGDVHASAFAGMLDAALAGVTVRPRFGDHPRIAILGPLEARLQQFDVMILAGLNEGTWPTVPSPDPWMSQPMRRDFGLPLGDRRIGLAAHDVAMMLHADQVVLTRAVKADGAPTRASRWLMRLDAVLTALGQEIAQPVHRLPWVSALDQPDRVEPAPRPAPRPPVALRPRTLRMTDIALWLQDPYAIYARTILGLSPIDPLDADPGAAERGSLIHDVLERFVKASRTVWPEDPLRDLLEQGRTAFKTVPPAQQAVWWPRFARIAAWFVRAEEARRASGYHVVATEAPGALRISRDLDQPFTLRGRADRIDRLPDGGFEIIDYKTGSVPSAKHVRDGLQPQLTLEALALSQGGFEGVDAAEAPAALAYWKLKGGRPPAEIKTMVAAKDRDGLPAILEALEDNLVQLIQRYDREGTSYPAAPPVSNRQRADYAHLARVAEWATGEEGD